MKEENIDCMKYRKSTHLAGIDVEAIIAEKGKCILTIEQAFYETNVDVSGKKLDGYFIKFKEPVKNMMVNSTNRKTIASVVKNLKNIDSTASRNIGNWAGVQIEMLFDSNVKMKGEVVGGIRIKPESPIPSISDENAINALRICMTMEQLKKTWSELTKQEQLLPTVIAYKENLKIQLNNIAKNEKL